MANSNVVDTFGRFDIVAGSTALPYLALIYFDGTDWELADGDAITTHATAVVITTGGIAAGAKGEAALQAVVKDDDAPYTELAQYYLSTTAGTFSTTAPSAAPDVAQMVGKAVSDSILHLYPGIEIDGGAAIVALQ